MGSVKSSQHFHPYSLLPYQHFPRCRKITCDERIEIYATGDRFADFVLAVPIRRATTVLIRANSLMP